MAVKTLWFVTLTKDIASSANFSYSRYNPGCQPKFCCKNTTPKLLKSLAFSIQILYNKHITNRRFYEN